MKYLKLADAPTRNSDKLATTDHTKTHLQVARYADWLASHSHRNTVPSTIREMNEYADSAGKTVFVGKRKVEIFAPFRPRHSALWVITRGQTIALFVLLFVWAAGLALFPQPTLITTLGLVIALYLGHLLMTIVLSLFNFRRPAEENIPNAIIEALRYADWPIYTILCPLYKEARVVPQFVRAMQALDYPPEKLQILFLTEEDDQETRQAIRALSLPPHFKIVIVPDGQPRTKPRACNYGLMQAIGQYVVIYDAEDIPEPQQLKKAVLTFANHGPNLACVQAKLNFYNPQQNMLTRWFTAEYSLWFDMTLPGLQQANLPLPLGGTSNHFPTNILRALGGWDAFNVTEDCDLGLRLGHYKLETVVLNSTTYEEANSKYKNWIRQRSRWIKGYMQTYLINMRRPLEFLRRGHLREFVSLQLVIGGKTAFLFLNPLLWSLFVLYLVLGHYLIGAYHALFPKPLLYAGAFTLIFGNFFYIYTYLLACLGRKQYRLIKWAILVPVYWLMMSVAACMALYQLITKPHYWEKTEHGLHLGKKHAAQIPSFASINASQAIVEQPTVHVPAVALRHAPKQAPTSSITAAFRAISTLPVPAFSRKEMVQMQKAKRQHKKDWWFLGTLLVACIVSITTTIYYFQQHEILLYGDAYSHMMLARRFFDSQTPGVGQLGGVWLPLPQMAMLPLIWNDYLWRSGLAGSISSMVCYIIATSGIFLAARRLTKDNLASSIGTLVFILNPNILYLQSTPLSELVCIAASTMACYFFLSWTQDNQPRQLVWTAASIFLATLARYDGWALFFAILVFIVMIGWLQKERWIQIQGNLLVFGTLGSYGIILWLLWNQIIFHDILYFQKGPYSAQGQSIHIDAQQTFHNVFESIRYYLYTSIETLGPILFILGLVALIIFFVHKRLSPEMFGVLTFMVPFAFYVLSMYAGQVGIFIPGANPPSYPDKLFNVRFGSEMVAGAAVCIALLASYLRLAFKRHWSIGGKMGQVLLAGVIIVQTVLLATGGIITLQDGLYGGSCAFPHPINQYLAEHYNGGRVLENTFTSNIDGAEAGLLLKDIVYDGSGKLWTNSLNNPAQYVDWIIIDPGDPQDIVAQHINVTNPQFKQQFTLVYKEQYGLLLYHRNGLPPLPTRAIPQYLSTEHALCGQMNSPNTVNPPND